MVVWDSSMSMPISKLRSDEYTDKILSSVQLWSEQFCFEQVQFIEKNIRK